jgi:hypothetical protein
MVAIANLIATAQRLITENGRSVTFVGYNSTLADASKPWQGAADPRATPDATLVVDAVFVEPDSSTFLGSLSIADDLLQRTDQILIVSPGAAADLTIYQEIIDGAERWKINEVRELKPGSSVALNFVLVRR